MIGFGRWALAACTALTLALPSMAQAETAVEPLTPGAEAGAVLGEHRFVLTFEPTAVEGMGLVRSKFQREGIFAELLSDMADQIALPQDIPVTFTDCGYANAFWSPANRSLTMCYELMALYNTSYAHIEGDEQAFLKGLEAEDVLMGTTLFILMHEMGHGLTDVFDLPITGKEEDAVDQFATITLIRADEGDDTFEQRPSRLALLGAYFFLQLAREPEALDRNIFSDEHALGQQRYYDVMCLVMGANPDVYAGILTPGMAMVIETIEKNPDLFDAAKVEDWLDKTDALNILPYRRAVQCEKEYARYGASWDFLFDTFMVPSAK